MNIRLLSLILILALASACQQTTTKEVDASTKSANYNLYPAWVLNPEINGFIAVSASAPKQNMGGDFAQRRVALAKARQQLAEQIRIRIKSESVDSITDINGKATVNQSIDVKTRSRVMLNMGNARILNEWIHPDTGELFIHYVTDVTSGI